MRNKCKMLWHESGKYERERQTPDTCGNYPGWQGLLRLVKHDLV